MQKAHLENNKKSQHAKVLALPMPSRILIKKEDLKDVNFMNNSPELGKKQSPVRGSLSLDKANKIDKEHALKAQRVRKNLKI